jgi:hypothetical protein
MKNPFFLATLFLPVIGFGAVANPLNISQSDIQMKAKIQQSCAQFSNIAREMDCHTHLRIVNAADMRGNQEYAIKHYQLLATPGLYAKEQALINLQKQARPWQIASLDSTDGEITQEMYAIEISWIRQELRRRHFLTPAQKRAVQQQREFDSHIVH